MALDYFSLKCFLTVATTRNITKSADIVGRTQSAVSQQLTRLEELLGKTLFDRNRDMCLTESGKLFFLYAQKISRLQQEALTHIQDNLAYKTLHFGFSDELAPFIVPHLFNAFSAAHPNVLLNMVSGQSTDILEQYSNKKLDICLIKEVQIKPGMQPKLCFQDELAWICQANIDLNKLDTFVPLILSSSTSTLYGRTLNSLDKHNIKYRTILSSNSFACKLSAVESGMGVMVASQSHVSINSKVDSLNHLPKLGKVLFNTYAIDESLVEADLIQLISHTLTAQNIQIK
ncbi:MAG: LysR family transcriptional regulator [Legionellaceae bacterium]|nr:LysR family transcriptional regulator [Legionellaceae bacterium]